MIELSELQKLKEEYPEFFKNTPGEVIDFVLSDKLAGQITNICKKFGVSESNKIEEVAYRIALVLLNRLPKESLIIALEKGMGLDADLAKKISDEAEQKIFSVTPTSEAAVEPAPAPSEETAGAMEPPEPPEPPQKPDTYREPLA